MLEYSYFLIILLLRLPQNIFNKRSSGIVRGAPAYFAYGAYRYLLSGGMALVLLLFAGGFSGVSLKALAISAIGAVALGSNLFFGLEALEERRDGSFLDGGIRRASPSMCLRHIHV